jgi:hypothetical protein
VFIVPPTRLFNKIVAMVLVTTVSLLRRTGKQSYPISSTRISISKNATKKFWMVARTKVFRVVKHLALAPGRWLIGKSGIATIIARMKRKF